ncbi:diaminohydroxyphosphoribosylaminopyrimidine deaminase/5-amino-6-(5-phosphoribosylamino)uracil reductase [Arthrobacter silviterrae]|uniref:Riboflavin biosynthesis protein RibD n=1 Tax=Arthrobacter silviterrae TaxID=2026658 RepID=A0ABX0DJ13_9MICC|nr:MULTISPECIES: bifunctional diaminohydroxyphosphoribosylaminopyrimidine deaminase/5-amino-6-(5-phosphoribosylamino)uracil reductase RibD [Arthrobacter]MCU6480402.1 bifunctional diaminohydroxyphosphoribosylaminopyrimidine deaminase/5-amino-6-(5-phosphoribosylamino)uracil reductase RibD [Arthrobacter sp. A2-55]MDQ0275891.1 diaminohydroxyphosphoribosylaminopyrimidine deaminase/5-amino-6-(5-phosphoribosylamino)uracil reductase [Arthrobacter silviterrae]NGN84650.1 bifunctional diaminohydroxyphospho
MNRANASSGHDDTVDAEFNVFSDAEIVAMETALAAARQGVRGANPLVGAVIIDADGTVLAIGHHRGAGTPHAEADVINRLLGTGVKRDLSAATIVVTLEPCNHQGRTGPCTQAILDAGLGNVVYAVDDPHTPAAGGADKLRMEGINVRSGLMARQAQDMNRQWFVAVREGRPFVTARLAQTVDSRIAAADGSSQWITSSQSRQDSHTLRGRVDAIVVGTGTILADNPRLTARAADGTESPHQPLRVVMGMREVDAGAAARHQGGPGFVQLHTHDPAEVLAELHRRGVGHLMIEGGSKINAAFLAAGLVDELIVYLAPTLLGTGMPALNDLGITTLDQAQQWEWDGTTTGPVERLGPDLKLTLMPAKVPAPATPAEGL